MTTKLFKEISANTYKRIIVKDPEPYLKEGWSLTAEPSKPKAKPKAKKSEETEKKAEPKTTRKVSRKKKTEE